MASTDLEAVVLEQHARRAVAHKRRAPRREYVVAHEPRVRADVKKQRRGVRITRRAVLVVVPDPGLQNLGAESFSASGKEQARAFD